MAVPAPVVQRLTRSLVNICTVVITVLAQNLFHFDLMTWAYIIFARILILGVEVVDEMNHQEDAKNSV